MRNNRGIDRDIASIPRKFTEVWEAIDALRSERRAAATTVGSGNWIIDGGDVIMLDTDGSVLFRLGAQAFGDRGLSVYRDNGTLAFEVAKPNALAVQAWRLKDSVGTEIVSESGFGEGLGRPRLPCHPFPTATPAWAAYGPEVSTTSATFTTLFAMQDRRQNPLWAPAVMVKCSDTTTSAEVRVVHTTTGTALTEFGFGAWAGVRPVGTTTYLELTPALIVPSTITVGDRYRFEIQARRTAGAGTVTLAIPESIGG